MGRTTKADSVHGLFLTMTAAAPDRTAIDHEGRAVSYSELERRSAWFANSLEKAGIRQGDLVGLSMERSPDLIAAMLGILRTGAAYVPLDATYPRERLDMMAEDAGLRAIIADDSTSRKLGLAVNRPVKLGELAPVTTVSEVPCMLAETMVRPGTAERDPAADAAAAKGLRSYVIFTSGSTGRPKGVEVTHAGVVNLLRSCAVRPGLSAGQSLLAVTTISFDIHVLEIFLPLSVGGRITLLSSFDSKDPLELDRVFRQHMPDVMQATPAQWRMLIDAGFEGHPGLKIIIGGEALTRPMADALLERCAELWNAYGPTETTVWSAIGRIAASGPVMLSGMLRQTSFHILKPELDISDADSIADPLVKTGEVGELWIGGSGVALGYLGRPDLTRDRFVELPVGKDGRRLLVYRTGDLVRRESSGDMKFFGRADFMVKISGHRIELGEIETALYENPLVRHAVAVAVPDPRGENRLIAYVEAGTSGNPDIIAELITGMRTKLPAYMVPSHIVSLEHMPLTPNGKIDRKSLPEPPTGRPMLATPFIKPRVGPETKICQLFAEMIGIDAVGAGDDFFELGGTSVIVPELLRRLDTTAGVAVSLRDFLAAPTPREMAAMHERGGLLADDAASAESDSKVSAKDLGGAALPPAVRRRHTVFLTGATGFVGAYLMQTLLATEEVSDVIALVRAKTEEAAYARLEETYVKFNLSPGGRNDWKQHVSVVLGDLSLPLLGLSPATFESIAERASTVLHNGAQVNLLYPYTAMRDTNVGGTREVLRLATTGAWKPVHYVSTLDVFDATDAAATDHFETVISSPKGLQHGYELSKWTAETMLANAAKEFGVTVSIIRLGMIGGDSKTGQGQIDDELNRFLRTGLQLRSLPDIEVGLRCVPVDVAADIISRLVVRSGMKPGEAEVLHVNPTAGISMDALRTEISLCLGLPVGLEDPNSWFAAVGDDPGTALFPLIDLFASGDPSNERNYLQISSLGSNAFSTERLDGILAKLNLPPPVCDRSLIRKYLHRLAGTTAPADVAAPSLTLS